MSESGAPKTALVLAGGGARGAYEAGVISILLPELEASGHRPSIYVGTSVGALNAVGLAANQHLPAVEQVETVLDLWRSASKGDVMRPIIGRTAPLDALRYAGHVAGVPGFRLQGLLDPTPLWRNLPRWVDFDAIRDNVAKGLVDVAAVVTTSARSGRTVVFYDAATELKLHRSHAVAYVPSQLEVEHVAASAAIPTLWPAVRIERPERARGWYVDGGTRLNAPIKPALDLGADQLAVIALDSIRGPVMDAEDAEGEEDPPDVGDGALHLLEGALVDPLIDDMRTLGNVNLFFARTEAVGARAYRAARGKAPYREVPYVFVAPGHRGAVGEAAARVWRRRFGGLARLRDPDFVLLNQLLGGMSANHGELLSLLFFDPVFHEELIEMGREDARQWIAEPHDGEGIWQLGPLGFLTQPREWTAG